MKSESKKYHYFNQCILRFAYHTSNHNYHDFAKKKKKNPQISLLKIMHPEILVVLYIHGHVYKNTHWIIFVTTSNSAFKSSTQIYIHEIKIQKYHYFNQCIQGFAYHTSNHNYHEYKFVYYINANATAKNNKVTGIAQLNIFNCANVLEHNLGCAISQHVDAKQLSSPTKWSQAMTNHN